MNDMFKPAIVAPRPLRPYQQRAIDLVYEQINGSVMRIVLQLPTAQEDAHRRRAD